MEAVAYLQEVPVESFHRRRRQVIAHRPGRGDPAVVPSLAPAPLIVGGESSVAFLLPDASICVRGQAARSDAIDRTSYDRGRSFAVRCSHANGMRS